MQKKSLSVPIVFLSALLLIAGLLVLKQGDLSNTAVTAEAIAPDITIQNARLRLPAPGQSTAGVFFDLVNTGGVDVLLSAKSQASDRVELHTHLHENGIMKMRQVEQVDVLANATTSFISGGLHVMVFNLNIPDGTTAIPMTLNFEKTGPKRIIAVVGGSDKDHNH